MMEFEGTHAYRRRDMPNKKKTKKKQKTAQVRKFRHKEFIAYLSTDKCIKHTK